MDGLVSTVTIYNDGSKDIQAVVMNHITRKPIVQHIMPAAQQEGDHRPASIDLANGDIIVITLADAS